MQTTAEGHPDKLGEPHRIRIGWIQENQNGSAGNCMRRTQAEVLVRVVVIHDQYLPDRVAFRNEMSAPYASGETRTRVRGGRLDAVPMAGRVAPKVYSHRQ